MHENNNSMAAFVRPTTTALLYPLTLLVSFLPSLLLYTGKTFIRPERRDNEGTQDTEERGLN